MKNWLFAGGIVILVFALLSAAMFTKIGFIVFIALTFTFLLFMIVYIVKSMLDIFYE